MIDRLDIAKEKLSGHEDGAIKLSKIKHAGAPLAVQWLRLTTSTPGDTGSIPSQGTKIPHAIGLK